MRIMHGVREVAGQGIYAVQGLRKNGLDAKMITWVPDVFGLPSDICLNIHGRKRWLYPWYAVKAAGVFVYALFRFDTFHFHFGYSLLPGNMDLWLLRALGKKIFFEFHGSDLRQPSLMKKLNPYYALEGEDSPKKTKKNIRRIRYADGVIVHDEELLPYLPEQAKEKPVYVVPLRLDLSLYQPKYPAADKKRVTIVHAPSKRAIKGTEYVIQAIEKLKEAYDIQFILVENMSHEQARKVYETADIIIDQLIIGTYGVFAVESMAMGKPVVVYITEQMQKTFPQSLPIVTASVEDIQDRLEELILDGQRRYELGIAGRAYVETYHDYQKNARILYEIYQGNMEQARGPQAFEKAANLPENDG